MNEDQEDCRECNGRGWVLGGENEQMPCPSCTGPYLPFRERYEGEEVMPRKKTPSHGAQRLADGFLADLEAERLVDPSCALAVIIQRVWDDATKRADAIAAACCCTVCGWDPARCKCDGPQPARVS